MAVFAIHYDYPDDASEMLKIRPEHREWLSSLPGLLVAGMYQPGRDEATHAEQGKQGEPGRPLHGMPANGALIVVSGDSVAEVAATFDHDPYWVAGFVLRRVVREWNPPLGTWVAEPESLIG
ncbi:MAG: YciI family protein [Terracoccus sp.]